MANRRWQSFFFTAAGLSFLASVGLWFLAADREAGLFVGLWVPSILSLGALLASRVPRR
jgi:hypothetical protein